MEISLNIGDIVLFGSLLIGFGFIFFNRTDIKTEIRFIKFEVNNLKKDVQAQQIISQQVSLASSAGPKTIEDFNITRKLSTILMKRFSVEELKRMTDDLSLNGGIEWASQLTAVNTILKHMMDHDRLMEVVKYIDEERKDIKF